MHGTAVAHHGRAALLLGASGAGKSSLALQTLALGAELVADDRTVLRHGPEAVTLHAPPTIAGMIEARGVGILHVPARADVPLALIVDLDRTETRRLPPSRMLTVMGQGIPLLHGIKCPHFPATVMLLLTHGLPKP